MRGSARGSRANAPAPHALTAAALFYALMRQVWVMHMLCVMYTMRAHRLKSAKRFALGGRSRVSKSMYYFGDHNRNVRTIRKSIWNGY